MVMVVRRPTAYIVNNYDVAYSYSAVNVVKAQQQ